MSKKTKIILSSVFAASTLSAAVPFISLLASCGSVSETKQDLQDFEKNANRQFVEIPNHANAMDTKTVVSKILHDKDGIKLFADQLADSMVFKWFKEVNPKLSYLKDSFTTKIDNAKKTFTDATKKLDGQQIQDSYLDPNGATTPSYIFKQTITDLKSEFTSLLFNNNYLALVNGSNVSPIEPNSGLTLEEIDKPSNVNATTIGQRNNFQFNAQKYLSGSDENKALQTGIADFIDYIFDAYVKENMPLITPSILYKNAAGPDTSGLFNKDFFTTSLTADGSYAFQFFKSKDEINANEINSSQKYQNFLMGLKTPNPSINNTSATVSLKNNLYVDESLKGAINIPTNLTEDSSTVLITNLSDSFDKYVTPYASAINYKFSNLVNPSTDVMLGDFNANGIMDNFFTKDQAPAVGYFKLPYLNFKPGTQPFQGAYQGITGIRDAVDISNSSFIMIRNEFGVHIIGIDRFDAIKEAFGGQLNDASLNKVVNELKNTLMWREAQDVLSGQKHIDLMTKLKDYFNNNFSKLVLGYAFKENQQDPNNTKNLFWNGKVRNPDINEAPAFKTNAMVDLAKSYIKFDQARLTEEYKDKVRNKIYENQSKFNNNDSNEISITYGLSGVLPYTRNTQTGEFDSLLKLANLSNFKAAQDNLMAKIDALMQTVEPGNSQNYFKDDNKPKGISTYVYTNNFVINLLLSMDTSSTIQKNLFDRIISNINLTLEQQDGSANNQKPITFGLEQNNKVAATPTPAQSNEFFNFAKSEVNNINPNVDYNAPAVSANNYVELNKWINTWVNKAIQDNIIPNLEFNKFKSISQNLNGNWTTADFATKMVSLYKQAYNEKNFNNGTTFDYDDGKELRNIITSLLWLMDWNPQTQTYTFKNLVKILKEPLENNNYQVGYVGWINQSNESMLNIAKQNNKTYKYGLLGKVANSNDVLTQLKADFKFKQNAILINKINSYSYNGATNPFENLATFGNDMYFGKNENNYYKGAEIVKSTTVHDSAAGFLGFQLPNSSYSSLALPNELFSSNQKLLTRNVSNPSENFKGFFYEYNTDNNAANAKNAFADKVSKEYSTSQVTNLAKLLLDVKFGFNETQLKEIQDIWNGIKYTDTGAIELTPEQRKNGLVEKIRALPDVVFQRKEAEYLWNNDENRSYSQTLFRTSGSTDVNQYLVTQFNLHDVNSLITADGYLDPTKLLGLNPDTFFKALLELATNSEVLSRASQEISDFYSNEKNQVNVLNKPLYTKIDNSWIKNKASFEKK